MRMKTEIRQPMLWAKKMIAAGAVCAILAGCSAAGQEPSYELGPEVLVSDAVDGGPLRVEPSTAIHGSTVIVAWNDSHGGMVGVEYGGTHLGWAISRDRANTFEHGGYLPDSGPCAAPSGADSWLATDDDGNFYLQALSRCGGRFSIRIFRLNPEMDADWHELTPAVLTDPTAGEPQVDKPSMSVAPDGTIDVVYTQLPPSGEREIMYVRYRPGSNAWSRPNRLSKAGAPGSLSGSAVTRYRDRVIAAWIQEIEDTQEVWAATSEDGGSTFLPAYLLHRLEGAPQPPSGFRMGPGPAARIANHAWLATTDLDGRPVHYLTTAEGMGEGGRILLFASEFGARGTWDGPRVVGTSPDSVAKVFPSVAAAQGDVFVLYYDRRDHPGSSLTDVYISNPVGSVLSSDVRLNETSDDWDVVEGDMEYAMVQRNMGDYVTLAADDSTLVATWTAGVDGRPRIFARRIEIR